MQLIETKKYTKKYKKNICFPTGYRIGIANGNINKKHQKQQPDEQKEDLYNHYALQADIAQMDGQQRNEFYKRLLYQLKNFNIQEIDIDENGQIELDEMELHCAKHNVNIPQAVVVNVFVAIDADCSGSISPIEYFKWRQKISLADMPQLCAAKPLTKEEQQRRIIRRQPTVPVL